jgi:hypothetical protein
MFGKYNGFVSKARVSACMYFLVIYHNFFIAKCPNPSENTNARVVGNEFYNGKEVEFVCPRDYILIPEISKKLTCENGRWEGIIPSCKGTTY